jgi:protein dpy-30
VQKRAFESVQDFNVQAMPTRAYAENKFIPFIYEALNVVEKERPENPLEFFAYYLLANNPNAPYNKD